MNNLGVYLIVISVSLASFKFYLTWKAQRAYMRTQREKNRADSHKALTDSWKRKDVEALRRERVLAASTKERKTYYANLMSNTNIGQPSGPKSRIALLKLEKILEGLEERARYGGVGVDLGEVAQTTGLTAAEVKVAFDKMGEAMNQGPRRGAEMKDYQRTIGNGKIAWAKDAGKNIVDDTNNT